MAGEIFISYRRADEQWARLLHAQLRAEGVDAWYDVHVGAGQDWRSATAAALEASRVFVLLFSRAAAQSEDIAKELAAATHQKKLIVPVRIEDIQPSGAFLYELASRNWVNAFDNTEARLAGLARSLAELVRSGVANPAMLPFDRSAGDAKPVNDRQRTRPRWRMPAGIALVAILVTGVGFALWQSKRPTRPAAQQIAFFGFESATSDAELTAIAASTTSEVFDALDAMRLPAAARAETLDVPPGERFARAERLGARYAFGGEVMRTAAQTTIAMRLEDVASRSTIWSESINGDNTADIVALPVRAAGLATDTLRCMSQVHASLRRDDPAVAKLLPKACREKRTVSLASIAVFRDLARAAPDSAVIQGMFAVSTLIAVGSAPESARAPLAEEAQAAARRALELDPRNPESWLAKYMSAVQGLPVRESDAILIEGLEVAPEDATLNMYHLTVLQNVGRYREAVPYGRVAIANDPLSGPKNTGFADLLAIMGLTAEAEASIERVMFRWPTSGAWQVRVRNAIFHGVGDPASLLATPHGSVSSAAVGCWRDIFAAYRSGDAGKRRRAVQAVKACSLQGAFNASAIPMIAAMGDLDGAFALLDEQAKLPQSTALRVNNYLFWPALKNLRADPRFLPLVEKLGLMAYWKQTGSRPDVCASEQAPFCAALQAKQGG